MQRAAIEQTRVLADRLQARRPEIERAVATRVYAVADPALVRSPEYVDGLRSAQTAALDYCFSAIEVREDRSPPLPDAVLAQARRAARHHVSLDVVLRRYFSGYTLLTDYLIEEAERDGLLRGHELQRMIRRCSGALDRLIAAVTDEYNREMQRRAESIEERRADQVRRLLAGEPVDTTEFGYDLAAWHLGVLVVGPGSIEAIRNLATALDRRLLLVPTGEQIFAGWLGGRKPTARDQLARYLSSHWPPGVSLAIGEPARGLAGWRLTHRQASAALPVVRRGSRSFVHYADVALVAAIVQDDLLATSLRQLYLAPLAEGRDDGERLRETLRAYFISERNVSATAAALGISRRTVANRLRTIEDRLGRPLNSICVEVEAAMRLGDLETKPPT